MLQQLAKKPTSTKQLDALKAAVAKQKAASAEALAAKSAHLTQKLQSDQAALASAKKEALSEVVNPKVGAVVPDATTSADAQVIASASQAEHMVPKLLATISSLQAKLARVVKGEDKTIKEKVEGVKSDYQDKLKKVSKRLIGTLKDQSKLKKTLDKTVARKEKYKGAAHDMAKRKNARKAQVHAVKGVVSELTGAAKQLHKKYMREKALRNKAIAAATKLAQRVKQMAIFGTKASKFAKRQARKASKTTKLAAKKIKDVMKQHKKSVAEAAKLLERQKHLAAELAREKARRVQEKAKALHEKAQRAKVQARLNAMHHKLKKKQHEADKAKAKSDKHKAGEKAWLAKAVKLKQNAQKAAQQLSTIGEIRKALVAAKMQTNHFKHQNMLQQAELAKAAIKEFSAANVTKAVAAHAVAVEAQALKERGLYKQIVGKAKEEVHREHLVARKAHEAQVALLRQVRTQLVQEHQLRTQAEAANAKKEAEALAARKALQKEHIQRLDLSSQLSEVKMDRDHLMKREEASAKMISLEREAAHEAKTAAALIKQAANTKLARLKVQYEHTMEQAKSKQLLLATQASVVTQKSVALKKAILEEKAVLHAEQTKAIKERESWKHAMSAMDKERITRELDRQKVENQGHVVAQQAQIQVGRAAGIAHKLAEKVKSQATKFVEASKDWAKVKHDLEQRAQKAEEAAAAANAKVAVYMQHREDDAATKVAVSGVEKALAEAKKSEDAFLEEDAELYGGSAVPPQVVG